MLNIPDDYISIFSCTDNKIDDDNINIVFQYLQSSFPSSVK